jgi:outer membrane protein
MIEHHTPRFLIRIFMFCWLASYGAVLLCQAPARAQNSDTGTVRLNLRQMIERATAVSPEKGIAESDLIAARSSLEEVNAAFYPRLESTAIVGPVQDADEPIIANNRIHDPSPGLGLSSIGVFGRLDLTVTQALYTFGKLSNRREAARMGVAAKELDIDKTADDIALRVSMLYYGLILARSGIGAAKDAENFFNDAQHRIKRLLKLKSPNVSESDLHMIDAFRAGVTRSQVRAQKGIRVATFALRSMLNIPPGVHFEVVPEPLGVKEKELEDPETLVRKAFSNRPEFKQLQAALKASKYREEAAVSDLYPSFFVALDGSVAEAPGRDHFDNPYIPDRFNHADVGVVAGARWEFDFGIKRARISEARARYRKLLYSKKMAEVNIPIQVTRAYDELVEWKRSAKIYQDAAIASRKWVVSAFADFDMGIGTAGNMLRAIEKYAENQGNYVEALYHYNVAAANLKYATGMIRAKNEG